MDNGSGLLVDARLSQANGTAEPATALEMLGALPGSGKKTVGADKIMTGERNYWPIDPSKRLPRQPHLRHMQ
jgi:hypothetical protein